MDRKGTFDRFFSSIRLDSTEDYDAGLDGIAKTLNKEYYGESSAEHITLVGSVGRGTAVRGASDVDVLFELPESVRKRFDNYESNGQSALLQEVKTVLKRRYPRTKMRGDGQVVVIEFVDRDYSIELVPAFKRNDGGFDYPDTHDGGSWKKTDPIPEQEAAEEFDSASSGNYVRCCNSLRVWKDTQGLELGGLLIDTLVCGYMEGCDELRRATSGGYVEAFKALFGMLGSENPDQSYWFALGSNQRVYNTGNGAFVKKAKKALKKLDEAEGESELEDVLVELFGKRFKDCLVGSESEEKERSWASAYGCSTSEQFIEDLYPVDIRYSLSLDCRVTQDGWRPRKLSEILRTHSFLRREKNLDFYISNTSVPSHCELLWKVRNCGEEAYRRNMVRGQIIEDDGSRSRHEHTDFSGSHFVECYCIENGVCVARTRIDVPIRA